MGERADGQSRYRRYLHHVLGRDLVRRDWAARVGKQAEQMLTIATAATDAAMRDELYDYAQRLAVHADHIAEG
jgi:hypothetical protein